MAFYSILSGSRLKQFLPSIRLRSLSLMMLAAVHGSLFASVAMAQSKFSIEGQLADGTDVMEIPFSLSADVNRPDPLEFRTWSHSGGTNNAGDVITAGGFDPTLGVFNITPTQIAFTDDGTGITGNFDSLLNYTATPTGTGSQFLSDLVPAGKYTLRLEPLGDSFGSKTKDWAVDITGPADVLTLNFSIIDLVPGSAGISKATLTGPESKWIKNTVSGSVMWVGTEGSGELRVEAGAVIQQNSYVDILGNTLIVPGILGLNAGSNGVATVSGSGSQWNNSSYHLPFPLDQIAVDGGDMYVGVSGNGTLNVEAGGEVNNHEGRIGSQVGSTGTATVTGTGSTWNNVSFLAVGASGNGTLNVEAGGEVNNTFGVIGDVNGTGTATVSGTGSKWNNSMPLLIGGSGNGTLNVEAEGEVNNTLGVIGSEVGSTGTATVTGTDSKWNNSGGLFLGSEPTFVDGQIVEIGSNDGGVGTLNVNSGGRVQVGGDLFTLGGSKSEIIISDAGTLGKLVVRHGSTITNSGLAAIGASAGHTGSATVTGAGSQWNNSDFLSIGDSGEGTLLVEAGGVVASNEGYLGYGSGSTGEATVTGIDSQWNNSSELSVGTSGNGTLNVEAGGVVTNTNGNLGHFSGSTGLATITGSGSAWKNSTKLFLGGNASNDGGVGTLSIQSGGRVQVGDDTSTFNVSELIVSNSGAAANLVVRHGSTITNPGIAMIGASAGHTGSATVTGAGSQWNNSNSLFYVGHTGTGTLNIEAGGLVSSTEETFVGRNSSSTGTSTVTGTDSLWDISSGLHVGYSGDGTLNIEADGKVTSNFSFLGRNSGSTGTATVTGAGSHWDTSTNLFVGETGNGTLQIEAGGLVTNSTGYVAFYSGSTSDVTVTGTGSEWNNSSNLYIGGSSGGSGGTGTLDIGGYQDSALHDGGTVTVAGTTKLWSGGTLTIDGYQSTLTTGSFDNSEGGMFHFDQGILNVNGAGGTFDPGTTDFVLDAGESVIMSISNTATATLSGDLTVGNIELGSSSLYIESGSTVSNTDGYIARAVGSGSSQRVGLVSVTGAGSEWNNSNNLYVGGSSLNTLGDPTGELEILDGGLVFAYGTTKINLAGTVTLDGGTLETTSLDITEGTFDMLSGRLTSLEVLGNLDNQGGTLKADGLVFITGDYTQASAASLDLTIPGSVVDEFGSIAVSGQVNLDGTLNLFNDDSRMAGDVFTIIGGDINGTFDTVNFWGDALSADLEWQVDYYANRVDVSVISTTLLAGDYNDDGTVDAADYTVWRDGGSPDNSQAGYDLWAGNYGATNSNTTANSATQSVPEPAAAFSLLLACLGAITRRRVC